MKLAIKDLLNVEDLSLPEVQMVLETTRKFKRELLEKSIRKRPRLENRTLATLFYQPSTRTRFSFEIAAKYLGMNVLNFTPGDSSVEKGESLRDTVLTLEAMGVDVFAIRHSSSGAPGYIAPFLRAHVLNAGDGGHSHPTQALLDIFTVLERKGKVEGLKVVLVGDHNFSRVVHSNVAAFSRLGARVVLCGPPALLSPGFARLGGEIVHDLREALKDADVVYTFKYQDHAHGQALVPSVNEFSRFYGITKERMALARPDAIFMHPAPMNRGREITSEVAEGEQSAVVEQVTNGVAVRLTLLSLLLGGEE